MFRFAGLGYAVLLTAVINRADYARLGWAWVVIAAEVETERQHVVEVEAAELGRLAGQQEAALRSLVGTGATASPSGDVDLRAWSCPSSRIR